MCNLGYLNAASYYDWNGTDVEDLIDSYSLGLNKAGESILYNYLYSYS